MAYKEDPASVDVENMLYNFKAGEVFKKRYPQQVVFNDVQKQKVKVNEEYVSSLF